MEKQAISTLHSDQPELRNQAVLKQRLDFGYSVILHRIPLNCSMPCDFMVDKRFGHMIRPNIKASSMTFTECNPGLQAFFDEPLLKKHLPPVSGALTGDKTLVATLGKYIPDDTVAALKETKFVNVHGRVVWDEHRKRTCLQYLYVWDYQSVPAHEADYEPIFIYLDGDGRYAIYDLIHYCTRKIDLGIPGDDGPGLRVVPGWHSFLPDQNLKTSELDKGLDLQPLSDQHLASWWSIPEEEPRLKIDGFIRNPFSLKAPGHFMDNPNEEAQTLCCTFREIEGAIHEYGNPKEGLVEGLKRAFTRCIGVLALYRLPVFIKLLVEMNDVGMITVPPSLRKGLNLGTIGQMLQDGFVKLTKMGSSMFEGFGDS